MVNYSIMYRAFLFLYKLFILRSVFSNPVKMSPQIYLLLTNVSTVHKFVHLSKICPFITNLFTFTDFSSVHKFVHCLQTYPLLKNLSVVFILLQVLIGHCSIRRLDLFASVVSAAKYCQLICLLCRDF
jgi:hypothetical protein